MDAKSYTKSTRQAAYSESNRRHDQSYHLKTKPRNRSKKFRRRRRSRGKIGLKPEPATVLRTVLIILHYVLGSFYGNEFHHPTDVNNVTTNGKMYSNYLSLSNQRHGLSDGVFEEVLDRHIKDYYENSVKKENIDALQFAFHSCGNKNYIVWLSVNLPYIRISFCIELKNCNTAYLNNTHTKGCYKSVLNVIKFKRYLSY
ncbi:hypothetical protein HZH68_013981 [Vespula germanica]|uniref:Uncharacterized protein n=1 Tax=Vespula germanica TaxID=30212 RepID=A0A834JBN9_VESGE|nr:hypothetical protein HZH68_013981 [Vespula germanica]